MGFKDKRVSLISDIIEGMKSIKYLGWERIFEEKIKEYRKGEFKVLSLWRGFDGLLGVFWKSLRIVL